MRFFEKLVAAFGIVASLSACASVQKTGPQPPSVRLTVIENEIDHPESKMARNIEHFSSDFDYVCLKTRAQPEAIIAAAEGMAWIEDTKWNELENYFVWNSSQELFERRSPEETPTFRLSVMDFPFFEPPQTSCLLAMPTQAVGHQSVLEEVEDFRNHFAKYFDISALEEDQEDQLEYPDEDYRLIFTYSFQIEIPNAPDFEVEYYGVRTRSGAGHFLSATWREPVEE